jgi:site-specific DNA recombinase
MTQPFDDLITEPLLTPTDVVELQRLIEAGLLARDVRLSGGRFGDATDQELSALEDQGVLARQRFIKAIYARISEDHEKAESVPTQIAKGTKYAERMGWDVVRVFEDKGLSGYTGELRPEFEEMIKFLGSGQADVLIARHHDRLTRNPDDFARLMQVCGKAKIKISLYTGGELDLSTASGGFYGFMETGRSWYESAIRSQRVKDAVERNARAGKRTCGGSRPFGYKINRHDLGEGGRRRYRIIGEEIEPAEAEAIREAAARVLRGESLRSIAFDFNDRGIRAIGGGMWVGSTLRRVLVSPRIAGLREHHGEVVGDAAWPGIIDRATHDRLVGLLDDPSRRRENFGRPRVHPLVGLVYCASCGGKMTTAIAPRQGRGYVCGKDENPICPARVRIVAEPLEAFVEGYVIDRWRNPEAIKIAQSDDDRMSRITEITDEMRKLQEQKNEALRMKLRGEVDAKTFRAVTAEIDAAHEQLAREHKRLASEAAMPELPHPSLAWKDLSAEDRRALTEMLVDKIIIERHPSKIDKDGRRHYTIRAIPYQDPQQEAERLKAVHEARVKVVPRV